MEETNIEKAINILYLKIKTHIDTETWLLFNRVNNKKRKPSELKTQQYLFYSRLAPIKENNKIGLELTKKIIDKESRINYEEIILIKSPFDKFWSDEKKFLDKAVNDYSSTENGNMLYYSAPITENKQNISSHYYKISDEPPQSQPERLIDPEKVKSEATSSSTEAEAPKTEPEAPKTSEATTTDNIIVNEIDQLNVKGIIASLFGNRVDLTDDEFKDLLKVNRPAYLIVKDYITKKAVQSTTISQLKKTIEDYNDLLKMERATDSTFDGKKYLVRPVRTPKNPPQARKQYNLF